MNRATEYDTLDVCRHRAEGGSLFVCGDPSSPLLAGGRCRPAGGTYLVPTAKRSIHPPLYFLRRYFIATHISQTTTNHHLWTKTVYEVNQMNESARATEHG